MDTVRIRNVSVTGDDNLESGGAYPTMEMMQLDQDLTPISYTELTPKNLRIGGIKEEPVINLNSVYDRAHLGINGDTAGKELDWKDNGDGTFTLIGR